MRSAGLLDFSHAVEALYCLAESAALDDFPGGLMALLQQHLDFDGAVFGFAEPLSFGDFSIAVAHVHQREPVLLDDYAEVSAQDPMTAAFLAGMGQPMIVDAEAFYQSPEHAPVLALTRRHRLRHLLLWGHPPVWNAAGRWLVLYRAEDRPFERASAAWLQAFWLHMERAIAHNREQALAKGSQAAGQRAAALVDAAGSIVAADPLFQARFRRRFGGDALYRLPRELLQALADGLAYEDEHVAFRFKAVGHYHVCELLEAGPASLLSPRERQVARLFAAGGSAKEIARSLTLSPYTVQSHLASVYRKLNVSDKAALARLLAWPGS